MPSNESIEGNVVIPYAGLRLRQPLWVKVGLWGISSPAWAWVFVWTCVAVAALCAVLGFILHPAWFLGTLLLLAAFWYWASIRWVDRRGGWSQIRE
jgi:hypothetical protein